MAIAHLSTEDYLLIGQAFTAYITAHGKNSVDFSEWPDVLGDELFRRAFEGGYFGPKGTIPGFPPKGYEDLKVKGVQVATTTTDDGYRMDLYVDGDLVASETTSQPGDTVAFAKRHGYDI